MKPEVIKQYFSGYHQVYAVYKKVELLGIFNTKGEAEINAANCGQYASIEKRFAIKDEESEDYHLLSKEPAMRLNEIKSVLPYDPDFERKERTAWKLKANMMYENGELLDAVKLVRQKTELGLKDAVFLLKNIDKLNEWGESES